MPTVGHAATGSTCPTRSGSTVKSTYMHPGGALHDLEGAARNPLQLVQVLVVPTPVAGAAEVPVAAVVGHQPAVLLQRLGDHLGAAAEPGEDEVRLQPQPQAHRRGVRVRCG